MTIKQFSADRLRLKAITEADAEQEPEEERLSFTMPRRSKPVQMTLHGAIDGYELTITFTGTLAQLRTLTQELSTIGVVPICKHL